jgi:two-component system cell cycle response regulator
MGARVLLIEDNPANLELMRYLLAAHGHDVVVAVDGPEALEAARRERPDLIICDVQLPTMDGCEVARRLKGDAQLRGIPLVAVTALAMVGDRDKVLAAGFDGYLAKPINPEQFVRRMEVFLRPAHHSVPPPAAAAAGAVAAPTAPTTRFTILVVDNLPVNLDLARSLLQPYGYRVVTAAGIAEGLARARETSCDLILSDVCMTGETGYDFLRAVRGDARLREIPFVFITSTMLEERDRAEGLALGADRFLCRPIHPEVFLAEIRACLRERGKE